jgi:hypothetical protein
MPPTVLNAFVCSQALDKTNTRHAGQWVTPTSRCAAITMTNRFDQAHTCSIPRLDRKSASHTYRKICCNISLFLLAHSSVIK